MSENGDLSEFELVFLWSGHGRQGTRGRKRKEYGIRSIMGSDAILSSP